MQKTPRPRTTRNSLSLRPSAPPFQNLNPTTNITTAKPVKPPVPEASRVDIDRKVPVRADVKSESKDLQWLNDCCYECVKVCAREGVACLTCGDCAAAPCCFCCHCVGEAAQWCYENRNRHVDRICSECESCCTECPAEFGRFCQLARQDCSKCLVYWSTHDVPCTIQ